MGTALNKKYSLAEPALETSESIISQRISSFECKDDDSPDKSTPSKHYWSKKSKPRRAQSETDLSHLQESVELRTEKAAKNSVSTLDRGSKPGVGLLSLQPQHEVEEYSYRHAEDSSDEEIYEDVIDRNAVADGRDTYNTNVKGQQVSTRRDIKGVYEEMEDAGYASILDRMFDDTDDKLFLDDTSDGESITGAQSLLPARANQKKNEQDKHKESKMAKMEKQLKAEKSKNQDIGEASNIATLIKPAQDRFNPDRKNIPVTKPKVQRRSDIKSQLIEVLDANGIVSFQIMHKPGTENQIEIIGTGVERLNEELSIAAAQEGYVVITKDVEFDSDKNGTTNWIHQCSGTIAKGTFALALPDLDLRKSVIDAIMQGKDQKRREIKVEYFGMTVAHAFLTEEQNETLRGSTEHFTMVRNAAIINASEMDYYVSAQGYSDIDISGNPRFLYKYWKPPHVNDEWAVMQDIVFFKLDNDQIRSLGLIDSPNVDVTKSGQQQKNNAKAFIINILSQDDLNTYVGHRIHCAGKSGKLIDQPYIRHEGCTLGHHLAFTLDNNERLMDGDCGSFLCLEEKDSGRLDILGMFIGQLRTNISIHQAVILSWNIRQVERTVQLKISDIKLAEVDVDNDSVAEEAEGGGYDSGLMGSL